MLAFQERAHRTRLARRTEPRGRFFAWRDWIGIAFIGAVVTTSVLLFYVHSLDGSLPVEHARANALAALSLSSAALVAGLSRLRTAPSRWICGGTVLLTVFLVQTPGVCQLLHLEALHGDDWLRAAGAAMAAGSLAAWVSRGSSPTSPSRGANRRVA